MAPNLMNYLEVKLMNKKGNKKESTKVEKNKNGYDGVEGDDNTEFDSKEPTRTSSKARLVKEESGDSLTKENEVLEKIENGRGKMKKQEFFQILHNYLNSKSDSNKNSSSMLEPCDQLIILENNLMSGKISRKEFEEKFKSSINSEKLEKIASGELQVRVEKQHFELHILNYYAYLRNYEFLKYLFAKFKTYKIVLKKDSLNKNLLEVGMLLNDVSLLTLLIKELIQNPPPFEGIEGLNSKCIAKLFDFHVDALGEFLDSRLFIMRNSRNGVFYNGFPKELRLIIKDTLELKKEELELIGIYDYNTLKKAENDDDEILKFFLEIKNSSGFVIYLSDIHNIYQSNNFLPKTIENSDSKETDQSSENGKSKKKKHWHSMKFYEKLIDNYSSEESIYSSKTLMAIADRKWKSFGKKVYVKDILFIIYQLIYYGFIANLLDYANNNDHSNPMSFLYLFFGYSIILIELFSQLTQIMGGNQGFKGISRYLKNEKNLIDLYYLLSWTNFVTLNMLMIINKYTLENAPTFFQWFFVLRSISNLSLCLKVIWLFQVNIRFGFMIRVIIHSARKTFFFFVVFILLIIGVIVSVGALKYEKDDWVKALNLWIRYFYYTYKLALGDFGDFFQLQEDDENSPKSRALFIYFFFSTSILTIILLNLLISILGKAYEEVKKNEMNYIYSATHSGLYIVEKNYSLDLDENFSPDNVRAFRFSSRIYFFAKFLFFLVFKRRIITRYPNTGKYMMFASNISNNELTIINKMNRQNFGPAEVDGMLRTSKPSAV